jgi:hypothetical protein
LIDMRDAPDAQVVLEIALVRAVRPDLDSGVEALVERVSALERSLTGAAAFPRPSAPAPAPAAAPEPSGSPAEAEQTPASDRPTAEVGRRPSLGAVRRSKQAAGTPASTTAAPKEAAEPAAASTPAAPTEATVADQPEDQPADQPADQEAAQAVTVVDRDALTEAWGDGILKGLPARAKALFSAGRFVSVDEQGAHFALPNAAHRDRCLEMVPTVEQKLTAHFSSPVTLVLDVDDSASAPQAPATRPRSGQAAASAVPEPEAETLDPAEYAEDPDAPGDQASEAHARLLEAFPGASEVLG